MGRFYFGQNGGAVLTGRLTQRVVDIAQSAACRLLHMAAVVMAGAVQRAIRLFGHRQPGGKGPVAQPPFDNQLRLPVA